MISIVIPALNEEKLLPLCLKSLKNQDYKGEYEIIVADNCSTDNTADVARQFGASVIACADRKSVFYARQAGADSAQGDIIAQADADTVYPQNWLTIIAEQFAAHPEAVAISGRFIYYECPPSWAKLEYFLRQAANIISVVLFERPLVISGATLAFRRNAFLAGNGYKGLTYSADQYGIAGRLSKRGRILYNSNLCVSTSPRSIQKPFIIILRDFSSHLAKWAIHFSKHCISTAAKFVSQTRARRVTLRLSVPAALLIAIIAYGYFSPTSQVFGKVYYKGSPAENTVALTFDDGPNEPYTSQILDVLNNYGVKATFFVIGKNVELYPETARRIVAEGHVLGNHSYSHNANHAVTEFGARDMIIAQTAIFDTIGIIPDLYRPPHGKYTPWELWSVKKAKLLPVTWSVAVSELKGQSAGALAKEIVKKTRSGSIILLHDGYGILHNSGRADKDVTARAVPLIIEQLQAKGFRLVTVPELLNVPAYGGSAPK